ncbi:MAG: site-specific integrase [Candidatus Bipolaricaulis sp.]|nr:site-specific integrase [Candidatus Bipolaricaulis sp.]
MAKSKVLIKPKKGRPTWQYKYDYMDHYLATPIINDGTKKSEKLALNWATEQLNKKESSKPIVFKEFIENFFIPGKCEWLADKEADKKFMGTEYIKGLRSHLNNYLLPYFKNTLIQEISIAKVKEFKVHLTKLCPLRSKYDKVGKPLSSQTICHILETLSIIMQWAEIKLLIDNNPVPKAGSPRIERKKRGQPTKEEIIKMFPTNIDEFENLWGNISYGVAAFIAADVGNRRSELLAARWNKIKSKKIVQNGTEYTYNYIVIDEAIKSGAKEIGKTKGKKARAALLSQRSVILLKYLKEKTPYDSPNDFIFPGKIKGKPLYPTTLTKVVKKVILKICENAEERNIVLHSFRHKQVTDKRRTMDKDAFMFMIGHENEQTTDGYDGANAERIIEEYIEQGKIKQEN